jgi:hypothetical protein
MRILGNYQKEKTEDRADSKESGGGRTRGRVRRAEGGDSKETRKSRESRGSGEGRGGGESTDRRDSKERRDSREIRHNIESRG